MTAPVWQLSVNLETKTATFTSGLADAAKAARGSFSDIKGGAGEMGGSVGYSMMEARHGVMLLGEEFGVHLPRALTTFLASIGPIGAAMEAAFPFLAVAVGATLLLEHLTKLQEAGEKLTEDQVSFGTAVNNAFNSLDQKLIQAQIKADELRNDHLGALRLQLELIDKQSLGELVHSFEEVAKAADVVMKDLEGHWYTFGIGSDGARHALTQFKTEYENLISQGKGEEATGLLKGTLGQAQQTLAMMRQLTDSRAGHASDDYQKYEQAAQYLKQQGLLSKITDDITKDEVKSQEALVGALQAQVGVEQRVADLKKAEQGNTQRQTGNDEGARASAAARAAAESKQRIAEQNLAQDRTAAEAQLTVQRASIEQRLAVELDFAAKDRDIKLAANAAEIAALDKSGKDYQNQLKALQEKTLEIKNEYSTKAAELQSKASVDEYSRDLRDLETAERQKIAATQEGSAARVAAIDSALKEEQSKGLADTNFFRELLNSRVQAARQEAEEEGKLRADAAREEADNTEKMGMLALAAEKQKAALIDSLRRVSMDQRTAEEIAFANQEYTIKMQALQQEIDGLDKSGKDYLNHLQKLQNQETQLTQAHENEITAIKDKAEQQQNQSMLSAYQRLVNITAQGLTQSIMGHQSWARTLQSLGDQVVSGMLENAIKSMMTLDMDRERQAAKAARLGFTWGMQYGGPAAPVLAPIMAAGMFAAVMAFEGGTDRVPGVGRGDIVPTMLEPGEGIVPGGVMDGLRNVARNGGFDQGGQRTVVHVSPTYHVQVLDGDGMKATLEKNADQLQRHVERTLRRMNR